MPNLLQSGAFRPPPVEKTIQFWDRIHTALSKPLSNCQDIANAMRYYWKTRSELFALDYTFEKVCL